MNRVIYLCIVDEAHSKNQKNTNAIKSAVFGVDLLRPTPAH